MRRGMLQIDPKRRAGPRAIISTKTGIKVKSKLEKRVADDLTARGVKYLYEKDKVPYIIPESKHVYTPDFKIPHRPWILETKGNLDYTERVKLLHIKASNPDLDLRLVFQRDNVIRKGSKTKYSDWSNANNFKWAVGRVPDEWLEE